MTDQIAKEWRKQKCWEAIVVDGAVTPGPLKTGAHQMESLKINGTWLNWLQGSRQTSKQMSFSWKQDTPVYLSQCNNPYDFEKTNF